MFCKWCGKKITNNGTACPHCGREQIPLVNGNGFWDLCDAKPPETNEIKSSETKENKLPETKKIKPSEINEISPRVKEPVKVENNLDKKEKKNNRNSGPLLVVTMLLALISMIVSISCVVSLNRIKELEDDVNGLRKKITSQAPEQTFDISGSEESIESKIADIEESLNDKISELKEHIEKLEHEIAELKSKNTSDSDNTGDKQNFKKNDRSDEPFDRNSKKATDSKLYNY
ncbi:hypothetical protein SAMN05216349_10316 [Oribacterium sp. KHPX15]|uniref:hypothetical protein n=1 Tax=Oribacterium sp. KHPX15 TaxID=1855342 RepID=UPI000898EA5E|nr:hypothetical protein [Oribacterium sp. KHPX15]SDZ95477.1 hypothetical protein SAMN05216349_10316 [Oribacterium sp. KHPX15]